VESRTTPRFRLYLITDRKIAAAHGGLVAQVEAALSAASTCAPSGAVAVQLREKDLEARALYELARALRERCSRYGSALLINDRIDVAIAAGADGIHLPVNSFAVADARMLFGPSALVGLSTHQPEEVASAAEAGADFVVYGPVYDPLSKGRYGPARGAAMLDVACQAAPAMPVYALGGITSERVHELYRAATLEERGRPAGVAVIGAILGADDVTKATRELLSALAEW
jgi:thiamine-phosphate pyrophosphorylase